VFVVNSCSWFIYMAFLYFYFERTWWRLFQKRVLCIKFDIYVFTITEPRLVLAMFVMNESEWASECARVCACVCEWVWFLLTWLRFFILYIPTFWLQCYLPQIIRRKHVALVDYHYPDYDPT